MVLAIARKFLGSANDRLLRSLQPTIDKINALEPTMQGYSDDELRALTEQYRERLEKGESLDQLLQEAFATVREASVRVLGMRHFDVQLIGGIILHRGMIAEMKTGEGKTLVCTLAAYLNAIEGKGVHVVTVNDYLASRDAEWMGEIYRFLGLSVGCITAGLSEEERHTAYGADITYGTNNEFGFDYLRDNMKYHLDAMVQRPHHFAIVDEVDSILIDEARTPLIISGPTEDNSELYVQVNEIIPNLGEADYELDEKARTVTLTEDGTAHVEELLQTKGLLDAEAGLYDIENVSLVHHVNQSLKAHTLFSKDVDYIVKDHKVVIIDEFTGRMMEGRRFSEGLHQALEAKEAVPIQNENQTLASVTFQNYFRLYPKLAGMTGTALTEAAEFQDIYALAVAEIPTHKPIARLDHDDEIYRTAGEKYDAIIELIEECQARRQPVLVGTVSIDKSEELAKILKKKRIKHEVLNARYHEKEAQIIAQAGRPGAVTIATNMAGRGTDIQLGGNLEMRLAEELAGVTDEKKRESNARKIEEQVEKEKQEAIEAGGLYVVASERHESRRIDNQLRGRSGRQGDPGATKFFLSLEDDLMRIFGSERMDKILGTLGIQEGEAITHPWMNKALEKAQQKVEARNYEIRKNLLKYDDVMNDQRKVFYEQRREILDAEDVSETVIGMREELIEELVEAALPAKSYAEQWDTEGLEKEIYHTFGLQLPINEWAQEEGIAEPEILERLIKATDEQQQEKESAYGEELMRFAEKRLLLHTMDALWKDHLHTLDQLKQGINLRAYGQRDPLNEYKQEAFSLFEQMLAQLRELVCNRLARLEISTEAEQMDMGQSEYGQRMQEGRMDPSDSDVPVVPIRSNKPAEQVDPADPNTWGKVRRNEPCPCGSGKKFKQCHGMLVS